MDGAMRRSVLCGTVKIAVVGYRDRNHTTSIRANRCFRNGERRLIRDSPNNLRSRILVFPKSGKPP